MTSRTIDKNWLLNLVSEASSPSEARSLPADIPMSIPGDIASALLEAGLIPDPYYGRNELDLLWIGKTDWILSTSFSLESSQIEEFSESGNAILEFEEIDTVAEITLNGRIIAETQNMFRRFRPDVSEILRSGENRLEVLIKSPQVYTEAAAASQPYPIPHSGQFPWEWNHRNLLRKVACHGGWDWGITLMTGGIYKSPVLSIRTAGRIAYIGTRQKKHDDSSKRTLTVSCEYSCSDAGELSLEYDFDGELSRRTFNVIPGTNILIQDIDVTDPELWWPAGQGEQKLYELVVRSPDEEFFRKIGFRTVEVISADDDVGRSMSFRINGRDIFAKGANWIPVDALPSRQTHEVYRRLLEDAVAANMNMIRLWGGGQYEKDIFYELCDELGIMIWHDMMFSCSLYPADDDFLSEVDAEVRQQIKRLKDHASIVLWCGNNEDLGALTWFPESRENRDRYLVDYDRLNEGVIGRAVKELDPDRTWWPSSPSAGEGDYSDCWHDDTKGDMHYWSVWHENLPFESYYDVIPRFCSEFGFQSFPGEKTVTTYAPEGQRNLTSPVMRHHQKNNAGNTIILSTMARYFRLPVSLADQLYLSQVQQAWAIRTAVDYWRANQPQSMGALYWQLNDNWPVASWSSIEYDGTWKLLHYEARRFFAPMRLSLYRKDGRFHAVGVNDAPLEASGSLKLSLMSFAGDILEEQLINDLRCPAGSAVPFLSRPLSDLEAKEARHFKGGPTPNVPGKPDVVEEGFLDRFVLAEWISESSADAAAVPSMVESLLLTKPRDCELADAHISVRKGGNAGRVILETDAPAFYVQAEYSGSGRFSDAGFTLLPGRPVELEWLPSGTGGIPDDLFSEINVRHLRGTY